MTLACAHLHDVCVGPYAISVWGLMLQVYGALSYRGELELTCSAVTLSCDHLYAYRP